MSQIIVCDLDGTLCNIDHRLHYIKQDTPDWDSFFKACVDDTPNEWCVDLITAMERIGYEIVFVSGRNNQVRGETETWINDYLPAVKYSLFMRPEGDHRPDEELKEEFYEEILDSEDILFVVDDRKKVVDMWRSKGLTVLHCAEGEF